MAGRVSQAVLEGAVAPTTTAGRVSQAVLEALTLLMAQALVSQAVLEALTPQMAQALVSQAVLEALTPQMARTLVSQVVLEALSPVLPPSNGRVSQAALEAVIGRRPGLTPVAPGGSGALIMPLPISLFGRAFDASVSAGLLVLHNTDASDHTLTIASVPDHLGREGDINYVIGAGEYALCGPFWAALGWAQDADGQRIWLSCDSDLVKVAVIYVD